MDSDIKNSNSYAIFCKKLLAFIRPVGISEYSIYDPFGVRLINRLHLGSHLREHEFRHNFADTVNFLCLWNLKNENIEHFSLKTTYLPIMKELINSLNSVIFCSDKNLENNSKFIIITATIKFIKTTKRFGEALF